MHQSLFYVPLNEPWCTLNWTRCTLEETNFQRLKNQNNQSFKNIYLFFVKAINLKVSIFVDGNNLIFHLGIPLTTWNWVMGSLLVAVSHQETRWFFLNQAVVPLIYFLLFCASSYHSAVWEHLGRSSSACNLNTLITLFVKMILDKPVGLLNIYVFIIQCTIWFTCVIGCV